MPQFHETGYGRDFFSHQLPQLIKQLTRVADALEEQNKQNKSFTAFREDEQFATVKRVEMRTYNLYVTYQSYKQATLQINLPIEETPSEETYRYIREYIAKELAIHEDDIVTYKFSLF